MDQGLQDRLPAVTEDAGSGAACVRRIRDGYGPLRALIGPQGCEAEGPERPAAAGTVLSRSRSGKGSRSGWYSQGRAGGKIDFHACRVAYISLVIESGATVREAQELARRATPDLTMNVYGRVRPERLGEAVERVAGALRGTERVPEEYRRAVGAETENATSCQIKKLRSQEMVELRGIEPLTS